MSEYQYKSTFDGTSSDFQSSSSIVNLTPQQSSSPSAPVQEKWSATGNLASFVCHVAYLESKLRTDSGSVFFDTDSETFGSKVELGQGATFRVQRAEWRNRSGGASEDQNRWGKYVALKSVLPKKEEDKGDWRDVLLEVRALLHEPLRYHPNIVRMLGLGWGPAGASDAVYPQLILEFSEIGSMEKLQKNNDPLPFSIKQKLCYDVGRGLSILHACGIVHGDLTHGNVLIYKSKVTTDGLPFTAKLSDFGGSVMDIARRDKHALRMTTWPFSPPETNSWLTEDGVKKTDVFSFGTFVWRTMIDCKNILEIFGLDGKRRPDDEGKVASLKLTKQFLDGAKESVRAYAAASKSFGEREIALTLYVLENTLHPDPSLRSLPKSQWALRGMSPEYVLACVEAVQKRNEQDAETERSRAPGSHGMNADGIGASLGKMGHDYDPQNNMPGYKPKMSHPETGEFLFEPLRLKRILDWPQQETIVKDFERAAVLKPHEAPTELQPYMAAFYLFQCYLTEFGVKFDTQKICYWLSKAAEPDESGVNYYAQAWIWRICDAFNLQCPVPKDSLEMHFKLSIMRGHRTCLVDVQRLIQQSSDTDTKSKWSHALEQAHTILNTMTAGLGMPYFAGRKLRRPYNMDNNLVLDYQITEELGEDYEHCLKSNRPQIPDGESATASEETPKRRNFESIFVNHVGHTLLHYAASFGKTRAVRHLVAKYDLDINVQDQTAYETPLVCACRGGHLDAAIALLELGASPNITSSGVESPLYWVSSFPEDQMPIIAQKLIDAGALIDQGGEHAMRPDVRSIWSDWEHLLSISVTPLGRAVIMNSLAAVKVLLAHGADPSKNPKRGNSAPGNSAIDLAAILNLPHILEVFILYLDAKSAVYHLFDEAEMLEAARNKSIVPFDTTSLQSRLVRHGRDYKTAMFKTLKLLRQRRAKVLCDWRTAGAPTAPEGAALCNEVRLGNTDIVEYLLEIGHSANGSPGYRPLQEAARANHEAIFRLLVNSDANVRVKYPVETVGQLSMLQIFASRPKTSRPGLFLAEYLIHAGVPVQPLRDGTRSPLAYALLNQDFPLAHLLLLNGVDINLTYQLEQDGPWITVLAELAQAHTERNLKSINYILSGGGPPSSATSLAAQFQNLGLDSTTDRPKQPYQAIPDFIVDKTRSLSILHILALNPSSTINTTSQLTPRIISTLLSHFSSPEQINALHPIYGTPLCAAVLASNFPLASALLDHNADTALPANPSLLVPPLRVLEPQVPQTIAMAIIQQNVNERTADGRRSIASLETLQAAFSVLELLLDEDFLAVWAGTGMARQDLERQIVAARGGAGGLLAGVGGDGGVVDLEGLKEMEDDGWKEGDGEMTAFQAMATMLKYVR